MNRIRGVRAVAVCAAVGYGGWLTYAVSKENLLLERSNLTRAELRDLKLEVPTRNEQLAKLKDEEKVWDILVIGGGATGTGIAVDAATRGLSCALVEREDFSSGTSSRSTKLIHGGVRYLQAAFERLDYGQFALVKEALHERANLLAIAPHLSHPLPIMLPIYKWYQVPYFWAGSKAYDFVASLSGNKGVPSSYFITKRYALERFPHLRADSLVGAMVYYDGQHNDSRMNVSVALTAAREGSTVSNYTEVIQLTKDEKGKVNGAVVRDNITGEQFTVKARCVITAAGPFTDILRQMDDPDIHKIVMPSAGVHLTLPDYYSPRGMGLLDPATSDGRVIFFLPWMKATVAGTTDTRCEVEDKPEADESDVIFILEEIKRYLSPSLQVRRGDVLSVWAGIRPLVTDPESKDTKSLSRNHVITESPSGLITIAGGKWTTYRAMAADAVNAAVKSAGLTHAKPSRTEGLMLVGGEGWEPTNFIALIQEYGLDMEVAKHLSREYGTLAFEVASMAKMTGKRWPVCGTRLVPEYPYIEAEVLYSVRKEYANRLVDILARRTRLAFINAQAAEAAIEPIVSIMAPELGWDKKRIQEEKELAAEFLKTMGLRHRQAVSFSSGNLSPEDIDKYRRAFARMDVDGDGSITIKDMRKVLNQLKEEMSDADIAELLAEVDLNHNGKVDETEFLSFMDAHQAGNVASSRIGTIRKKLAAMDGDTSHHEEAISRGLRSIKRSGGGV
eukprot:Clim_evm121s147 gene=Clim_evmTU121s147